MDGRYLCSPGFLLRNTLAATCSKFGAVRFAFCANLHKVHARLSWVLCYLAQTPCTTYMGFVLPCTKSVHDLHAFCATSHKVRARLTWVCATSHKVHARLSCVCVNSHKVRARLTWGLCYLAQSLGSCACVNCQSSFLTCIRVSCLCQLAQTPCTSVMRLCQLALPAVQCLQNETRRSEMMVDEKTKGRRSCRQPLSYCMGDGLLSNLFQPFEHTEHHTH